jgi:hypothetical protein
MSRTKDSTKRKGNQDNNSGLSNTTTSSGLSIDYRSPPNKSTGDNISLSIDDELARLELETFDDFVSSLGDFGNPDEIITSDKCVVSETLVLQENELANSILRNKTSLAENNVLDLKPETQKQHFSAGTKSTNINGPGAIS